MIIVYSEEARKLIKDREEILNSKINKTFKDFIPFDWEVNLIDSRLIELFGEMGKRTKFKRFKTYESIIEFTENIEKFKVLIVYRKKLYLVRTNLNDYMKSVNVSSSRFTILKLKSLFEKDFIVVDTINDYKIKKL